ncbi:MAG: chromosomal replication initiator protein DnaA [Clostridiales bacterium]|nr:chromosomal replication initiator protein DnaA [Clostridiales bacterium]
MQEIMEMWQKVLDKMQNYVSTLTFDLWIKKLEPLEIKNDDTLMLAAHSNSAKNTILAKHSSQLNECIHEIFGEYMKYEILDNAETEQYLLENNQSPIEEKVDAPKERAQFNEKYTFNNFVVGKSNQFCYAAAHAVAEHPGTKFNPLLIYSGVGLGKTHLMHAIGNYLTEFSPNLKVRYVTCEKFMNEYIESLGVTENSKEKAVFQFREKYRNIDVLMIDDIQFIANKNATKEEFFHTFNELYQNGKQIIITSDRAPSEIDIEDRIKSRLSCGLIQDMQIPEFETKMAILKKKAQLERYYIDDEVLNFIAEKPYTNIREMEGALSKVSFYATLMGKTTATMEDAYQAFKEDQFEKQERITPENIIKEVCNYFNISEYEITGKKKSKDIVEPRMIAIYLIDNTLNLPLVTIGKIFGGRDHTTIMHSREKITEQIKRDNKMAAIINDIKAKLSIR